MMSSLTNENTNEMPMNYTSFAYKKIAKANYKTEEGKISILPRLWKDIATSIHAFVKYIFLTRIGKTNCAFFRKSGHTWSANKLRGSIIYC